jgi:hypothetical protein
MELNQSGTVVEIDCNIGKTYDMDELILYDGSLYVSLYIGVKQSLQLDKNISL